MRMFRRLRGNGVGKSHGINALQSDGSCALAVNPASNPLRRMVIGRAWHCAPYPRRCGGLTALLAFALTGCAHQPIITSCLTQAQYEQMKAAEPAKVHGKLTGKADADIRPITGSAIELRAWGEAELGLLSICAAPNK